MSMKNKHLFRNALRLLLTGTAMGSAIMSVQTGEAQTTLTVRAAKHGYKNALVMVRLPESVQKRFKIQPGAWVTMQEGTNRVPAQFLTDGKETTLTFLLDDLRLGDTKTYTFGNPAGTGGGPV